MKIFVILELLLMSLVIVISSAFDNKPGCNNYNKAPEGEYITTIDYRWIPAEWDLSFKSIDKSVTVIHVDEDIFRVTIERQDTTWDCRLSAHCLKEVASYAVDLQKSNAHIFSSLSRKFGGVGDNDYETNK